MNRTTHLVLEDGSVFTGASFGGVRTAYGEVVFNTSMTGYQEILTDPSYAGQIVVATYPLIGNYGINSSDIESRRIQVAGYVVKSHSRHPSHFGSMYTIHEYLESEEIPGLSEIDTRAITRRLRSKGAMMGCLTSEMGYEQAMFILKDITKYIDVDHVTSVSTKDSYVWDCHNPAFAPTEGNTIVVVDCGLKYNILRSLQSRGWAVIVVPANTSSQKIKALKPSGVVLSPGPGDPARVDYLINTVRDLIGHVPIMGICLGHQLLARAFGAETYKLKFGHRGGNHPVKDLSTSRVYITSQNHGFAVDGRTLSAGLEISHVNLNDDTVEGITHTDFPVLGIQFHSEAAPGPLDNQYLFDRFLTMAKETTAL